jgi:hypothetical protein
MMMRFTWTFATDRGTGNTADDVEPYDSAPCWRNPPVVNSHCLERKQYESHILHERKQTPSVQIERRVMCREYGVCASVGAFLFQLWAAFSLRALSVSR